MTPSNIITQLFQNATSFCFSSSLCSSLSNSRSFFLSIFRLSIHYHRNHNPYHFHDDCYTLGISFMYFCCSYWNLSIPITTVINVDARSNNFCFYCDSSCMNCYGDFFAINITIVHVRLITANSWIFSVPPSLLLHWSHRHQLYSVCSRYGGSILESNKAHFFSFRNCVGSILDRVTFHDWDFWYVSMAHFVVWACFRFLLDVDGCYSIEIIDGDG